MTEYDAVNAAGLIGFFVGLAVGFGAGVAALLWVLDKSGRLKDAYEVRAMRREQHPYRKPPPKPPDEVHKITEADIIEDERLKPTAAIVYQEYTIQDDVEGQNPFGD